MADEKSFFSFADRQSGDSVILDDWSVSIYLSDGSGETGERIRELMHDVWQDLGFDLVAESDPILGSFFQKFRAKAKSPEAQQALHERLMKLERAAELRAVSVPESQANMQNAQAFASIVQALDKETSAAIALGPLLVLKTSHANGTSTIYSKMLTTAELRALERRPELLKDPETLLLLLNPAPLGEPGTVAALDEVPGAASSPTSAARNAILRELLHPERPARGSLQGLDDPPRDRPQDPEPPQPPRLSGPRL